jgi:site-specific recombinase XerD
MAKAVVVTYECEQCSSEVIVTRTGETMLSPIYCCGMQITEVSSVEKKPVKPKKKAAKKVAKKVAKKRVAKRKKPAAKKKASKK